MSNELNNNSSNTASPPKFRDNELELGQCFLAYVNFREPLEHQGKNRPIVIFRDMEEDKLYAFPVTSQIDTPFNKRYGYKVKDLDVAGFSKDSVIQCHSSNLKEIKPENIKRQLGNLSERDVTGLLIKSLQVRQMEKAQERRLSQRNELER